MAPFAAAVSIDNASAIEVLQRKLTFEDIAAFTEHDKGYEWRLRPIVERQCACLVSLLNRDVVGVVFKYLGFTCQAPDTTKQKARPA